MTTANSDRTGRGIESPAVFNEGADRVLRVARMIGGHSSWRLDGAGSIAAVNLARQIDALYDRALA